MVLGSTPVGEEADREERMSREEACVEMGSTAQCCAEDQPTPTLSPLLHR